MANNTINVVVGRKRPVIVTSNVTGGIIDTKTPVTLKNVSALVSGVNAFDELVDVNLAQRTDGSVPIYDQPTDTYVVKHIDFTDIDGDLDGGTF